MIASLPMYDRPETAAANDQLWAEIRNGLGHGPESLNRDGDLWDHWQSPNLLLSQTCGYPYRARLHDKVTLVASPCYDLPDCPDGYYYSVLIARKDDPRSTPSDFADSLFAYNEPLSQSGWAAPQNHAKSLGFTFKTTVQTGAHRASARAVVENRADCASIDALTWLLLTRHDAFTQQLKVIAQTEPTPALPYITSLSQDADRLREAMRTAISNIPQNAKQTLGLRGVMHLPKEAYLAVPNPPPPSQAVSEASGHIT